MVHTILDNKDDDKKYSTIQKLVDQVLLPSYYQCIISFIRPPMNCSSQ